MKFRKILMLIMMICNINFAYSQTAPFQLPHKWKFGKQAGLNFISGTLPTSPILSPPVYLAGNPNTNNQEGATSVSDTTRNIVYYTPDGVNLYNGANALVASNLKGATSSTQNSISFPDPASPATQFYIVTCNVDPSGGSTVGSAQGINFVVYNKTTGTLVNSGSLLAVGNTGESITVSSDLNGGYWIIAHQAGASIGKTYYTWHITSTGVSGVNTFNGTINGTGYQGSLKINTCQNKIGFVNFGGGIEIYNWNASSGTLGSLIYSSTTSYGMLYGAEFSPDGTKFYFTSLVAPNLGLYQIDMSNSNALTTVSSTPVNGISEFGTMQLGVDGKIYVINSSNFASPAYIPTITAPNNPTATAGYNTSYFRFNPAPFYPNFYRGIANLAWTNPNLPNITATNGATCYDYNFKYKFKTYFNVDINTVPNSEIWDFGDGTGNHTGLGATPSYKYTSIGTYTVTLTVTDAYCNQTWKNTLNVTISCPLPVELINFTGIKTNDDVKLIWSTAKEVNNDRFVIERSTDGVNFTPIGTIKGSGNSGIIKTWSSIDYNPRQGVNYYRLAQYDTNESLSYSNVISINYGSADSFLVYPNPFTNEINVEVLGKDENETITIILYDVLGREVKMLYSTTTKTTFGSDLKSGYYIIKILKNDSYYITEIIKK